jgi:hypothetical protein
VDARGRRSQGAEEIGGDARFIELANSTHVVGAGDTLCGSTLVRQFVSDPSALASLDASCAPAVSPIHAVGVYAARLSEEQPLATSPAGSAPALDLRRSRPRRTPQTARRCSPR